MIDFRYHLVSIVAVFLALGLGILMGTAVLNDALVESLRNDIDALTKRVDARQLEIDELDRRVDAANVFADEVAPWLTSGVLDGRVVVVIQLEGAEGDVVGAVRDAVEDAGAELPTTIVLSESFALRDQIERDQLALVVESTSSSAVDLRADAGRALAARLAGASAEAPTSARPQDAAHERLRDLLDDLEDMEFVAVDAADEAIVPANAMFLVVGGAASERTYDPSSLVAALTAELSSRAAPTLVAEPSDSSWGIVQVVRDDPEAGSRVSTVDHADTVEGRIAVVLGLARTFAGISDHYGLAPGATHVIPEPAPAP